jgi:hypothetical protein
MRLGLIFAAALAGALAFSAPFETRPGNEWVRSAHADEDVAVGTALLALKDVRLQAAAIKKGSTVTVRGVVRTEQGRTLLDVELADGHVLRGVQLSSIRSAFRVVV